MQGEGIISSLVSNSYLHSQTWVWLDWIIWCQKKEEEGKKRNRKWKKKNNRSRANKQTRSLVSPGGLEAQSLASVSQPQWAQGRCEKMVCSLMGLWTHLDHLIPEAAQAPSHPNVCALAVFLLHYALKWNKDTAVPQFKSLIALLSDSLWYPHSDNQAVPHRKDPRCFSILNWACVRLRLKHSGNHTEAG